MRIAQLILEILSHIFGLVSTNAVKKEARDAQNTLDDIDSDPYGYASKHFNSVQQSSDHEEQKGTKAVKTLDKHKQG